MSLEQEQSSTGIFSLNIFYSTAAGFSMQKNRFFSRSGAKDGMATSLSMNYMKEVSGVL
jgi:hypothetical protein